MSDLLERATRASRQTPTPTPTPDETRARILATVRREAVKPPRRLRHSWAIPLVAALVATGAAAAVGTHPFALFSAPAPAVSLAPAPPAASPARGPRSALRPTDAPAESSAEPPVEPLAPVTPPTTDAPTAPATASAPTAAPTLAPTSTTASPAATTPPAATAAPAAVTTGTTASRSAEGTAAAPTSTPKTGASTPDSPAAPAAPASDDPAEALYREAHALHFRGGDAGAAVAAWERYLAAAPRGRFAPEARYNRALALLRAGRREAGLAALAPFASAPPGSYRQAEAQRLLEAASQSRQDAPSTSPAHP